MYQNLIFFGKITPCLRTVSNLLSKPQMLFATSICNAIHNSEGFTAKADLFRREEGKSLENQLCHVGNFLGSIQ